VKSSAQPTWHQALANIAEAEVSFELPLAPRTSFRMGGPAEAFAVVHSRAALGAVLGLTRAEGVPLFVWGGGSNLLVADQGVRGLVLKLGDGFDYLRPLTAGGATARWEIGAACSAARALRQSTKEGLAGLEMLAGVPGTLGGAVKMNAGGREGALSTSLRRVELWQGEAPRWAEAAELGFAYRTSQLPPDSVVVALEVELVPTAVETLRARIEAAIQRRRATQPLNAPSAGSVFKNPTQGHAGQLIEAAGCKGWREGGAEVSPVHANFIVNQNRARAIDAWRLIERVRAQVLQHSGITLELEVRLVGSFAQEVRS